MSIEGIERDVRNAPDIKTVEAAWDDASGGPSCRVESRGRASAKVYVVYKVDDKEVARNSTDVALSSGTNVVRVPTPPGLQYETFGCGVAFTQTLRVTARVANGGLMEGRPEVVCTTSVKGRAPMTRRQTVRVAPGATMPVSMDFQGPTCIRGLGVVEAGECLVFSIGNEVQCALE